MKYTLSQIKEVVGGSLHGPDRGFSHVATDSRTISNPEQTLFIARKGPHFDGHDFVPQVVELGVRAFILERDLDLPSTTAVLKVKNGLRALQDLAAFHRRHFGIPVIAITGSNGKTIVKEWADTMLSGKFVTTKSPGSYNSQLGVPLSVLLLDEHSQIGLFEAGISQHGEMNRLEEVIFPTIGLITNIGAAHDAGFKSRAEKIAEKSKLFVNCDHVICCRDHQDIYDISKETFGAKLFTWSQRGTADISFHLQSGRCQFEFEGNTFSLRLPFSGAPHEENLLHAIALCCKMGLTAADMQQGLDALSNVEMRLSFKEGRNQCYLLDDTYNNDINGLEVALSALSQQRQRTKKTLIISDFLQVADPERTFVKANELMKSSGITRLIGIGPDISNFSHVFDVPSEFFLSTADFLEQHPHFHHEMILIKGAREFHFEKIVQFLTKKRHRTELTINFTHLQHNLNAYRRLLQPQTKVMVMVKAFAYGGGSFEVANFLQYHQVDYLAVAYLDEGISLRDNGIELPIMVMNPSLDDLEAFARYELEPEIFDYEILRKCIDLGLRVPIHLKIDTGMKRLGFDRSQIAELVVTLEKHPDIRVGSVFTHLAASEDESHDDFTLTQRDLFDSAYQEIVGALGYSPLKHAVNSAGIVRWPNLHFEMVRLGVGLLGVDTTGELILKPAGRLRTEISQVRKVRKGESIGYSRVGIAPHDGKVAVLPIGYADGYLRVFGNGAGKVLVNNQLVPTIGNICMDMTMIDVSGIDVSVGDEVIIVGEEPTLEDLATWSHTIPYEILTNLGPRVSRTYAWN